MKNPISPKMKPKSYGLQEYKWHIVYNILTGPTFLNTKFRYSHPTGGLIHCGMTFNACEKYITEKLESKEINNMRKIAKHVRRM